jgi:phage terminase large subunit-like protein
MRQWLRNRIERGVARSIALIGATLHDVWKDMVEGEPNSPGLVNIFPPKIRDKIEIRRADREIIFPNGAIARIYTAEEPELRGPNVDTIWGDELGKWKYAASIWDNIEMICRSAGNEPPKIGLSTTPRPIKTLMDLLDDPDVHVTFGSTFANAQNLARTFIRRMERKYGNTRLGSQELFGELLTDNPDALFHQTQIDGAAVVKAPELKRIVVSVDPAISSTNRSDLVGIGVAGIGYDNEIYILADYTGQELNKEKGTVVRPEEPKKHTPEEWGDLVIWAYHKWGADAVVVERNRGGDLVAANVRASLRRKKGEAAQIKIAEVVATRGKAIRAEPVATMYEKGQIHHVGSLPDLEKEMTVWNPKTTPVSPNRVDWLVWAVYELAQLGHDEKPDPSELYAGLTEVNQRFNVPAELSSGRQYQGRRRSNGRTL